MREQLIQMLRERGFTYHTREMWEPREVLRSSNLSRTPASQSLSDVTKDAVHYTSAIDLPDGDPDEILGWEDGIRQLLIRSNWDYLRNRKDGGYRSLITGEWFPGYPLGYSWGYDWMGGIWEINGVEFRPAATSQHNTYTKAHLVLTDRADPASELMLRSVREVRRVCRELGARQDDRPWAHGWFKERTGSGTATACCGPAVKSQIDQGKVDMSYVESEGEIMNGFVARPNHIAERILDTRVGGGAYKLRANKEAEVTVPGSEGASHAILNLTVVNGEGPGHLIAWTGVRPVSSKINWYDGKAIANEITVPLTNGKFKIWALTGVDVICDLVGYYKPV